MRCFVTQAEQKAAAEAYLRRQEELQREAERKAALRERAEAHRQEAHRAQVQPLCRTVPYPFANRDGSCLSSAMRLPRMFISAFDGKKLLGMCRRLRKLLRR
jgi:hypothetical protein